MKIDELHRVLRESDAQEENMDMRNVRACLTRLGYDADNFYQEVEMQSRFVDAHRDVSYGTDRLNLHSHDFYEILYCRSNSGIQYLVGTERYRLQRGDIVLLPPGIGHRPLLYEDIAEPYDREVLWLGTEFVRSMVPFFLEGEPVWRRRPCVLRTAGTGWEGLGEYFRLGTEEARQQAYGWQAALCGNTIRLLALLERALRDCGDGMPGAEKPELLDEVVAYIEQHLAEKITLSDAAKRFWVSESTICQTFRQKMDVSFHHFITQRRLIAAKCMILEGRTLETVSESVGFADYSSFYRAFRQEYGISPRQYRRMQMNTAEAGRWSGDAGEP